MRYCRFTHGACDMGTLVLGQASSEELVGDGSSYTGVLQVLLFRKVAKKWSTSTECISYMTYMYVYRYMLK